MTSMTFAVLLLAANLAAAPEKAAAPAAPAPAPAAPAAAAAKPVGAEAAAAAKPTKPAKPAKPGKASKEAIKDAQAALLGPCSAQMATTKVKAVSVIDGVAMNTALDEEKSKAPRADVEALFMVVEYDTSAGPAKDIRQVSTFHHLTTEQAQVLVGQPMCVFGKAP